jgi:hypothetical protein
MQKDVLEHWAAADVIRSMASNAVLRGTEYCLAEMPSAAMEECSYGRVPL